MFVSTSLGNAGKIHLKGFSLDSPWQHAKRGSWDISKFKDQQAFCIFLVCCWLEVSVLGGTFLHILFAGSVKLHWKLKFHEKFLQFFYVFIGFLLVLLTFSFIPALNGTKSLSVGFSSSIAACAFSKPTRKVGSERKKPGNLRSLGGQLVTFWFLKYLDVDSLQIMEIPKVQ